MYFDESILKKLLLKRDDIEKALGVKIQTQTKEQSELNALAMFEYIDINTAIAVFLGLNFTDEVRNHPQYRIIYSALEKAILSKKIDALFDTECDYRTGEVYLTNAEISHDTAKLWAETYGLKWNVPPYRPISKNPETLPNNNTEEIEQLKAIIKQQAEEIDRLKVGNLSQPIMSTVSYDDFSIYGHSSENLEILFEMVKKIANKCDPENLHSYPKKEDFIKYVKDYLTDNQKLAESLYQIIIPEKVKARGNTPKGVDTFQGFI